MAFKKISNEDFQAMLIDCERRIQKLEDWEAAFVKSIRSELNQGVNPNQRQKQIIDKLWDKATEKA